MLNTTYCLVYSFSNFTEKSAGLNCKVLTEENNSYRIFESSIETESLLEIQTIYNFFNLVVETMRTPEMKVPEKDSTIEKICKSVTGFQDIQRSSNLGGEDNSIYFYFCLESMTLNLLSSQYYIELDFESYAEYFLKFMNLLAKYFI
jgi:hypothetical protein